MSGQLEWGGRFLAEVDRLRRSAGLGQVFSWRARQVIPQLSQSELASHVRQHRYEALQTVRNNDAEAAAGLLHREAATLQALQQNLCELVQPLRAWKGLLQDHAESDAYGAGFLLHLLYLDSPLLFAAADVYDIRQFSQDQLTQKVRRLGWQLGQIVVDDDACSAATRLDQRLRVHINSQQDCLVWR